MRRGAVITRGTQCLLGVENVPQSLLPERQAKERAWQAGVNEYTKAYQSSFAQAQQEYDWFKSTEMVRAEQNYDWFKTAQTTEAAARYDWFKTQEIMGAEQAYNYFTMQQQVGAQQEYGYFTMQQQVGAEQKFTWDMNEIDYQQEMKLMKEQARLNEPTLGDYIWNFLTNLAIALATALL